MKPEPIIHEQLRVTGSRVLDAIPREEIQERRLLTVSDGSRSVDLDVRVTEGAIISLGGRDVDDFIEEWILERANRLVNDGRKLQVLEASSPLTISTVSISG